MMSDTTASLMGAINSAGKLQSVGRLMKALAGSSVGLHEQFMRGLADHYRTVERVPGICLGNSPPAARLTVGSS